MTYRLLPLLLLLALARGGSTVPRLSAQDYLTGSAISPRDSLRLLNRSRSEQARFERIRRGHLPWTWGSGGSDCDERIGRFCFSYRDDGPDWEPPPEPEAITEARTRLLQHLESVAEQLPGEPWIAGQRVRYLMEARRYEEAAQAALACRAMRWWCLTLGAFVHHYASRAALADSTYEAALRLMPREERHRWLDPSPLLDACTARAHRAAEGQEREEFERRFWKLADPFYSAAGNEVRSEHLSRNLMDRLQDRARTTERVPWGDDLREILLRFGWPTGWQRIRPHHIALDQPGLVSHYPDAERNLLPPCALFRPDHATSGEWDPEIRRPRTGYSLPFADSVLKWWDPPDHQIALFRRGDSAVVAAAYDLTADSAIAGRRLHTALAILPQADPDAARIIPFPYGGAHDAVLAGAPNGTLLLSLEMLSEDEPRATRVRLGTILPLLFPHQPALSDLLLLRSARPLPDSLPDATRNMRGSSRVHPGESVGVYWEIYGLSADRPHPVSLSLRLIDRSAGWLQRLAEGIGLRERSIPVLLRWQETLPSHPVVSRSLEIRIPEDIPGGDYLLELTASLPGLDPLRVQRELQVR